MKLEFIEAGEIVTTHGVRGEIKLLPWVDSPEFMLEFERVVIGDTCYKVEACRVQKTCNLMKLQGVDTVEQAMALRGRVMKLYRSDISDEVVFADELIGMQVIAQDGPIGEITEVLDYPGNKVYVVKGQHSYMIPAVKQFVLDMDLTNNVMHVALIEGMRTDEN